MSAAIRALLRERVKVVSTIKQEEELLEANPEDEEDIGPYLDGLRCDVAELDRALRLLKETKQA